MALFTSFKKLSRIADPEQWKALGDALEIGRTKVGQLPGIKQFNKFLTPDSPEQAKKMGLIQGAGGTYIDPTGMLGITGQVKSGLSRGAAKLVAKSGSFKEIFNVLKGEFKDVAEGTLRDVAKKLIPVKSVKEVQSLVKPRVGVSLGSKVSVPSNISTLQKEIGISPRPLPSEPIIPRLETPALSSIIPDVKKKVNFIDYFKTPENVLNKVGLGKEAKLLRTADEGYKKDLVNEIQYLKGLMAKAPSKESATNIFKALDGQPITLTPAEQEVATELQGYLKTWADKLKLPEDKRISNYITHIFEKDFIKKEFDPDLAKLIDDQVAGSVYDPFVQERLGKMGYKENVWQALDAYVKRGTRKVNFDPALEQVSQKADLLDLETYKYIQRYVSSINMRPTEIDNLIDNAIKSSPVGYKLGQRPTAAATNKFRRLIYRGSLGLNFGSAVRNLTQGVNTYAKLGEKYTALGYSDMAKNFIRNGLKELKDVGVLNDNLIEDRAFSVMGKTMEKVDKGLWSLFDFAEKVNRGSAYFGAKRKALNSGLTEEKAIDFAKKVVRQTQFTFGKIDTPVALSSDVVKTLAQFQTFNLKQAELLTNMFKGKEFAGLVRWLGASTAILYTVGELFGMKPTDLIPTVRLGGSPVGNLVSGALDQTSPNKGVRAMGQSKIKNVGFQLIPGGVQAKKTVQGLEASPGGTVNDIRGALFGKTTFPKNTKSTSEGLFGSFKTTLNDLLGPETALASEAPSYEVRGNKVWDTDLEEARAILFGEVSNRSSEKQMLEAQTILNTAINRMNEYRKRGKEKTLTEVLQMSNQYQAYKGKQYEKYKSGKLEELDQRKIDAINKIIEQLKKGTLKNNIGDYVFYTHKPDGRIIATSKKLFK